MSQDKLTTVELDNPIKRGDTEITSLQLRKPSSGEMRGLLLHDVLRMDVKSLNTLIPRITVPPITRAEAEALEAEDLLEVASATVNFFMTRKEKIDAGQ